MSNMTQSQRRVKIGVLLRQPPEDLGEWLADAAAFDAAGVDALWVDTNDDARLDPLAVTAALAALTFRSLLVTSLPEVSGGPEGRVRTLATVARLSRGRLALCGERARLSEVTRAEGGLPGLVAFYRLGDGVFVRITASGDPERWVPIASPDGRAAWRAIRADAVERGVGGLLVPAGARLLDILRNPDGSGDRGDLQLAQG